MGGSQLSLPVLLALAAQSAPPTDAGRGARGAVTPPGPPPSQRRATQGGAQAGRGPAPIPVPPPGGRRGPVDPFTDAPKADMSPSTDLSRTWGYSRSKAPPKPLFADDPSSAEVTPNPIGFYSGVRVQAAGLLPPWAPADPQAAPPTLTWPGFERAPRSSRIFFQISRPTTYQVERQGTVIRVRLAGTRVDVRNNLRPLDLRFQKTPVAKVVVRRQGEDAVAVLTLRAAAEPTVQTVTADNGTFLLVLEFPDEAPASEGSGPAPTP